MSRTTWSLVIVVSAEVLVGVPAQVEHQGAGQDADDVDEGADRAEGEAQRDVEHEQEEEESGHSHGAPAEPLFHGDPFHRLHEMISFQRNEPSPVPERKEARPAGPWSSSRKAVTAAPWI